MVIEKIHEVVENTLLFLVKEEKIQAFSKAALGNISVSASKNVQHGDYATNAAMVLAKQVSTKPNLLAKLIVENWQDPDSCIGESKIAGPGFINLTVSNKLLHEVIRDVLEKKEAFGTLKPTNATALVEFISANPTGPLHLGHARGAFFGDAISNILSAAGFKVTKEFYVNDAGVQVKTLAKSVYARYLELFGKAVQLEKDAYPGEYVIDIAKSLQKKDGDKWLNRTEEEALAYILPFSIDSNIQLIKKTLKKAGIQIDEWYFEHTLYQGGKVQELIETYRKRNMLYEADCAKGSEDKVRRKDSKSAQYKDKQMGGTFLKTSQFGDEEDRILVKKNGENVYLSADLAYHKEKYARGFNRIINVQGADHAGHAPRIFAGMEALGLEGEKTEFALVQIVRLLKDKKEVRFSKRSGQIYLLDDLLDEIGSDAARFIFLMRGANTQFDFDLDLILQQNTDNPVFYVQYGHARMATLLKKAETESKAFKGLSSLSPEVLSRLNLPEERAMLMKMSSLPRVISQSAQMLEPHRLIFFCQELIGEFHSYFTKYRHSERIISEDETLTQARLSLVAALKQTLYNALKILSLHAPESMKMS